MMTLALWAALAVFPVSVQETQIPAGCGRPLGRCPADANLEWRLEEEYWRLLDNVAGGPVGQGSTRDVPPSDYESDVAPMGAWLRRAYRYRNAAPIPAHRAARLDRLISAGELVLFRDRNLDWVLVDLQRWTLHLEDLERLPGAFHLGQAVRAGNRAFKLDADDVNTQVFHNSTNGFLALTLPAPFGGNEAAEAAIQKLLGPHPERCQDEASCRAAGTSTEGIVVAAMLLTLHHDPAQVRRALALLGDTPGGLADCSIYACSHTTSLAPGKRIGGLMVIAEAYAKVGALSKMRQVLDLLESTARAQHFPFMDSIAELRQELEAPDGLRAQWASGWRVGLINLPLPPSTSLRTCQACHFGGTRTDLAPPAASASAKPFSARDTLPAGVNKIVAADGTG